MFYVDFVLFTQTTFGEIFITKMSLYTLSLILVGHEPFLEYLLIFDGFHGMFVKNSI